MSRALKYHGPNSAVTLRLAEGGEREVLFHRGQVYSDLPEGNAYIGSLVDRKLLVPVEIEAAAPVKTKKGEANAS